MGYNKTLLLIGENMVFYNTIGGMIIQIITGLILIIGGGVGVNKWSTVCVNKGWDDMSFFIVLFLYLIFGFALGYILITTPIIYGTIQ